MPSLKPRKVMSPPSLATAGRTRVSINSLMVSTVSASASLKNSVRVRLLRAVAQQRFAEHVVFHDGPQHGRLEMLPVAARPWSR